MAGNMTQTDNAVGICTIALQALGSQPINSFEEGSEGARLSGNLYNQARNDVLRQHPWNCAQKRVVLSPSVDKPEFGYANKFLLPGDYVSVISVEPDQYFGPIDYAIEGQYILCNADSINLLYVFRNEIESTWSRDLVAVMIARMRMELAYPITKDRAIRSDERQNYELVLARAKLKDGQETPPVEFYGNPLLDARFNG